MAAGSTYTPLATNTLGTATSSITFSSISGSYTDLFVMCNGQNATQDGWEAAITFNSDTGSNYSFTYVGGNGSTASSSRGSNTAYIPSAGLASWTTVANSPGIYSFNVMNYSNTTTYKTTIGRNGYASGTYASTDAVVGLWRNTNAITSITLTVRNSGSFATGTTFTLYGIAAA
jgi:hypothetical protein